MRARSTPNSNSLMLPFMPKSRMLDTSVDSSLLKTEQMPAVQIALERVLHH